MLSGGTATTKEIGKALPPVWFQTKELEDATFELGARLSGLTDRLAPVSSPTREALDGKSITVEDSCELEQAIHGSYRRVCAAIEAIDDIAARLRI